MGIFSCIFSNKQEEQEELLSELILAAEEGDVGVVKSIIAKDGSVINLSDDFWRYPLGVACEFGRVECAALLIKSGAKVNLRFFSTPLHYAAKNGNLEMVRLLLEHGADVNATDVNRCSPIYLASYAGHAQIVKFLLEHGADVNATNKNGDTSLYIAKTRGHNKVVDLLERFLEEGYLREEDDKGLLRRLNIDLVGAIKKGNLERVTYLLEVGASVESVNANRHTPLSVANWFLERRPDYNIEFITRIEKIAELLKQHGATE